MCNIRLENISKVYKNGDEQVKIIKNINLEINSGDSISIMGSSGVGKTTFLKILGLLEYIDKGRYLLNKQIVDTNNNNQISKYRRNIFGYIPQDYGLIEKMSVYDNIALPLYIRKSFDMANKDKVYDIAKKLNIDSLLKKDISKISLGERQRVAIARALVKKPPYLLADEPTASLDTDNKKNFIKIMNELDELGTTMIIITHDDDLAKICKRQFKMFNGTLELGT